MSDLDLICSILTTHPSEAMKQAQLQGIQSNQFAELLGSGHCPEQGPSMCGSKDAFSFLE